MNKNRMLKNRVTALLALALLSNSPALIATRANADEGGTSFWLPGQYGSLIAVPTTPGFSLPLIYYHSSVDAGGSETFSKGGNITAGLDVDIDLLFVVPTYAFTTPVLGGQASVSMATVYGNASVDVDATLTGPGGQSVSGNDGDSSTAFGDLYPTATLRWNNGNHNTKAYTMLGVPVGSYDQDDLANIGTNHWAIDMGGGYTYLNMDSGREFSAVLGFTYNFENPDTDYQNGIDSHLDWAASQFLSEQLHVGLVGYFYYQLTGDSGDGGPLETLNPRSTV